MARKQPWEFFRHYLPASLNLTAAITISLAVHALVLAIHFTSPDLSRAFKDRAMEIVLVNSRSSHKPRDAQALAQANLDGGGNTAETRRASTPLPPSPRQQEGTELEQAKQRVQALEAQQGALLTRARSQHQVAPRSAKDTQPDPTPKLSGRDMANNALAMARMEGEVNKNLDDYNKRPRRKFLGTRTSEYRFAQYMEGWRLKVERVGTLNYPAAARGKLYGSLVLSVTINSDGSVEKVELERTSGEKVLDIAALNIVKMANPFQPFPPDIKRDVDQLVITRTWFFTNGDQLQAR